ncbi:MAG: SPFH domain-containing protein, partial [Candidatus Anammoxibacter sp.]
MAIFKFPKFKLTLIIVPIAIIITIGMVAVSLRVCIIKISIDQVGVKTVIWGVRRGIVERDFQAGWHRAVPGTITWDIYDSTVQTLEMTEEHSGAFGHDERDVLKVRTKDDYDVSVDLIVKYRIRKGEAWALKRDIGSTERYKLIVENEARDIARSVFGKMDELDLYNPAQKRIRAEEGKVLHQQRVKSRHVEIIDWLILDIRFDPGLDRKIKSIKVAELDEVLNISKGLAASQRGTTQTIDAETEAVAMEIGGDKERKLVVMEARISNKIIEIIANADKYMVVKKAKGDRYKAEKVAAGSFLVAKARADGERLRREAMSGLGGNMIVAIEAAKNLNLGDLLISTQDVDLLNIDYMVTKLGAEKEEDLIALWEKNHKGIVEHEDIKVDEKYNEEYNYDEN